MYPVSATFAAAITQSHRLAILVEIMQNGVVTGTLDTVTEGSVTLDAKAAVRGRLDLTVVDDGSLGLVPTSPTDRLAPYGTELKVSRGIRYPDGSTELVPLGVFRIEDTDVADDAAGLTITIAGQDRAARIADARFEDPGQIDQGTPVATAILTLIQAAYPDVAYSFHETTMTTPLLVYEEGGDRWQLAQDIATGAASRLYFDREGTLILAPESTGAGQVTIAEGENGVLITSGRKWTRQGAYNRAIVTGENTGETAPARGIATDENPLSPTYYFGPFGRVPTFLVSRFVTTNEQATDAAQDLLTRQLGSTQSVDFGSLVLPHVDPGDVARITRARVSLDENHVLDAVTIPLTAEGTMTGGTRATQVAE